MTLGDVWLDLRPSSAGLDVDDALTLLAQRRGQFSMTLGDVWLDFDPAALVTTGWTSTTTSHARRCSSPDAVAAMRAAVRARPPRVGDRGPPERRAARLMDATTTQQRVHGRASTAEGST